MAMVNKAILIALDEVSVERGADPFQMMDAIQALHSGTDHPLVEAAKALSEDPDFLQRIGDVDLYYPTEG